MPIDVIEFTGDEDPQDIGSGSYLVMLNALAAYLASVYNEVEAARDGEDTLLDLIQKCLRATGLTENLSAGGHLVRDVGEAELPGDVVNLAVAQALLSLGGTPSNISVLLLNKGAGIQGQALRAGATLVEAYCLANDYEIERAMHLARQAIFNH